MQALYQLDMTDAPVDRVVDEFVRHRLGGDIDGDRAVLTEGHSPRPDDGLRDELLGRGSPREARDHRDVEVVEGESSRRLTIAVRKAADTERRTGPNTAEHPARLGLRGVDRRHRQIVP